MGSLTIYKQWKKIVVPVNSKGNKNDENEELKIINEQVTIGEVYKDFQQPFQDVTVHVALKRIQARVFQEDMKDANSRVVQIDDAMSHQCQ